MIITFRIEYTKELCFKMAYLYRIWDDQELQLQIDFAKVHCSRLGYDLWIKREHDRFQTMMCVFDDDTLWLERPNAWKPFTEEDRKERREFLKALQDQWLNFIDIIQLHDYQLRNWFN